MPRKPKNAGKRLKRTDISVKDQKRFWRRVKIVLMDSDACWEFDGPQKSNGYCQIKLGNGLGPQLVHRVAYALTFGEVPAHPATVEHVCRNPKCCRPEHLRLLTAKDNRENGQEVAMGIEPSKRKYLDKDRVDPPSCRACGTPMTKIKFQDTDFWQCESCGETEGV